MILMRSARCRQKHSKGSRNVLFGFAPTKTILETSAICRKQIRDESTGLLISFNPILTIGAPFFASAAMREYSDVVA